MGLHPCAKYIRNKDVKLHDMLPRVYPEPGHILLLVQTLAPFSHRQENSNNKMQASESDIVRILLPLLQ